MEGPSLVILKEELGPFVGRKVRAVEGNTTQPKEELAGRKLDQVLTWGKQLYLTFSAPRKDPLVTRTHFLMFGSYTIDEPKPGRAPRLELRFDNGTVFFYACSFRMHADEDLASLDPQVDVLSASWNEAYVTSLLEHHREEYLCDLLLDQDLFAGSGNIVKNEVLFNLRRHPLTKLRDVRRSDWPKIVSAVREYCENFYEWKKRYELRKHWQVYRRGTCPLCGGKLVKENVGRRARRNFWCPRHQAKRATVRPLAVHEVLPMREAKGAPEARVDH